MRFSLYCTHTWFLGCAMLCCAMFLGVKVVTRQRGRPWPSPSPSPPPGLLQCVTTAAGGWMARTMGRMGHGHDCFSSSITMKH